MWLFFSACSQELFTDPLLAQHMLCFATENQYVLRIDAAEHLGGKFLGVNGALIRLNDLLVIGLQSSVAEIQYIINHVTIFCCLHTRRVCAGRF